MKNKKRRKGKVIAKPNRQYKDSVFVDIFSRDEITRRKGVISLYNALHEGEKLDEDAKIEFLHLKNVIYRKLRNDVSFIANGRIIVLIEHQSTINKNMALRMLLYVVAIYELLSNVEDRYSYNLVKIPTPEFYVIYNGSQKYPARIKLRLSKSFIKRAKNISLELVVKVININHPENKDFLEKCELLKDYKTFVDKVRELVAEVGVAGYDKAIKYCLENNILPEYLPRNIREAVNMLQVEYDHDTEMKVLGKEMLERGIKRGRAEGRMEGRAEGRKRGRMEGRAEGIEEGFQQGSYNTAINNAKEMLDLDLPIDTIMKVTKLKKDEVLRLMKNK